MNDLTAVASAAVDVQRAQRVYDVESYVRRLHGGVLVEDPYPAFRELREAAPVHAGSVAELLGVPQGPTMRPEAPHYAAFSYEANNIALKDNETFSSAYYTGGATQLFGRSILEMVGEEHRRYRILAQGGFVPRRRDWWIERWIEPLVDDAVSAFEGRGTAELNAELCARIPLHTITSSFGLSREEAWRFREMYSGPERDGDGETVRVAAEAAAAMLSDVIAARRRQPQDDIITMLVQSELAEDGQRHLLTDEEIFGFARLILLAGSGTTWRQLGILLVALLRDQQALEAVRADRSLVPLAIEEAVRWEATDPVFRRLVTRDVTLCGVDLPAGAVLEVNLGAANRDPSRWEDPDRFIVDRPQRAHLGFAGGPHVCLGMHVARAEMTVALNAVLDRLPNIRFAETAAPPRIVGLEHRGPTSIDVVFG